MNKDEIKFSKGRNDERFEESPKQAAAKVALRLSEGLTCNEAQVDDLLSKGESI